jgi:MFS family permease
VGSLTAATLNHIFSPAQMMAGGWRIAFLTGGVFGFIAMWLRRWLQETPVFEEMRNRAALSRGLPLGTVLRRHGRAVITSILSTWMLTAAIVIVILLTPSLMPKLFGLGPASVQAANLAATGALCVSVVVIAAAADRYGIRRVYVPVLLFQMASAYALYHGAATSPSALMPLYVLAGLGTGGCVLAPIAMVRAFPASVRFSGVSFSYNLATRCLVD